MPALQDRDRAILYHVCRYRLSINPVLEQLFFRNVKTRNTIVQRLREQGLLSVQEKAFGANRAMSYYFPSEMLLTRAGFPSSRAKPLTEQDLNVSLAVLGFCCLSGRDRLRLDREEVASLLGIQADAPLFADAAIDDVAPVSSAFVVESAGEASVLYEVSVPSSTRTVQHLFEHVEERIGKARDNEHLRTWLKEERYGFAILVDQQKKQVALSRRLEVEGIQRQAKVLVEVAPSPSTIEHFLRHRGQARPEGESGA